MVPRTALNGAGLGRHEQHGVACLVASSGTVRSIPLRAPRTCSSTIGCPIPVLSRPQVNGIRRRSIAGNAVMKSPAQRGFGQSPAKASQCLSAGLLRPELVVSHALAAYQRAFPCPQRRERAAFGNGRARYRPATLMHECCRFPWRPSHEPPGSTEPCLIPANGLCDAAE